MDIEHLYRQTVTSIQDWLTKIVLLLPNLLVAILMLVLFIYVGKQFSRLLQRILGKFSHNINVNRILSGTTYVVIIAIGIFIALSILNLDKALTSLLAGAGIIGIALSFAFQDVAANFMSGVIIAVRRPFTVGELVETKEYFGRIESISMRTTKLVTLGGQLVIIPNKDILQNALVNYNYTGHRRVDLRMRVHMNEDLERVQDLTIHAMKDIPFLEKDKEIEFFFTSYGDNCIRYLVRFWITAYFQKDYLLAKSQAIKNIKLSYEENGIRVPLPIHIVKFRGDSRAADPKESPSDIPDGPEPESEA